MLALCHDWRKVSLMKRKKEDYRQVAFHGWIQEGGWGWMSSAKSHSSSRSAKKLSTSSCSSKPSRKSKQFMYDSFYFLTFTDFVAALNLVQLFSTLLDDQCMPANSCIYYTRASCLWIKNIFFNVFEVVKTSSWIFGSFHKWLMKFSIQCNTIQTLFQNGHTIVHSSNKPVALRNHRLTLDVDVDQVSIEG